MTFMGRIMRGLDPGAAAVWILGLVLLAMVLARGDETLGRMLMRCAATLVVLGYVHLKAFRDGRDDHESHLLIGLASVGVGILALFNPGVAAPAVIALAVTILLLELTDSGARYRGARWSYRAHLVRLDFSFGAMIGLLLLATAPSARGQSPGPVLNAAAGLITAVLFAWCCLRTRCEADDPGLFAAIEAQAVSERMLHGLEPELVAKLHARMSAGSAPARAPMSRLASPPETGPIWDTTSSVAPPGYRV
jgi:hypothetical protein